jgi:hypothetical protein
LLQEQCGLEDDMPEMAVVFVTISEGKVEFLSFVDNSVRVFIDEYTVDPRLGKVPLIETIEEFEECGNGEFFVRYYVAKTIFPNRF